MASPAPEAAPRAFAVLDTNVCLDLFVFADPRAAKLHDVLQAGTLRVVCDADCREEWRCVLAYPQWKLDVATQATHLAQLDALADDDASPLAEWHCPIRAADIRQLGLRPMLPASRSPVPSPAASAATNAAAHRRG